MAAPVKRNAIEDPERSSIMKAITLSELTLAALAFVPLPVLAFTSGSTGADGPFNPQVNTEVQVPVSGVFNFTSVNIPAGVTVKFRRNTTNTPVVILSSGDVTVAGTIDISGGNAAAAGAAGDGNLGDDSVPGAGGPGGYDGGRGGLANFGRGGPGVGPGAGQPGHACAPGAGSFPQGGVAGGAGGSFAAAAATLSSNAGFTCNSVPFPPPQGGPVYGSSQLLPLVGGSGGGGASGGAAFAGSGGGGGGGALLIAASGTVAISGSILANGGRAGDSSGAGTGSTGGGGSGGAVRILASTISGNGTVSAQGGAAATLSQTTISVYTSGTAGANGRIRLESDIINRTAATTPAYTFSAPGAVFVAGFPKLRIARVAGIDVPAQPSGNGDVILPATTPNPVAVEFESSGVPVGNTVKLTVTPPSGAITTAVSNALSGSTQTATASASVNLPTGPSILSAQTTYTIVAALGDELSRYAQGERVEKVRLGAVLGGRSTVTLITVSGKEFAVPQAALAGWGG
jgi:hypothetical protein